MDRLPANEPYHACYEVANEGGVASGGFYVRGGGLGVPVPPEQRHAPLPPGASRRACLFYRTTPQPGSWRLEIEADSHDQVIEILEGNNTAALSVVVE